MGNILYLCRPNYESAEAKVSILRGLRHKCVVFQNIREAEKDIRMFGKSKYYGLVIGSFGDYDGVMGPEDTNKNLVELIKEARRGKLAVLVVAGETDDPTEEARQAGANKVLEKPVFPRDFLKASEELFGRVRPIKYKPKN